MGIPFTIGRRSREAFVTGVWNITASDPIVFLEIYYPKKRWKNCLYLYWPLFELTLRLKQAELNLAAHFSFKTPPVLYERGFRKKNVRYKMIG